MFRIAIQMLLADRAKFYGLLFGISFTAFLVSFALSYFAGFMTRGFALISENPTANVWVMDPAVRSTEMTINLSDSTLDRVKSVAGVNYAVPLAIKDAEVRFPNGHFQRFQFIGVDDATLVGVPKFLDNTPVSLLHIPDAVSVDPGGTEGKLLTPRFKKDQWPYDGVHLGVPMRPLQPRDELLVNDHRIVVTGLSKTIPRFPPRPLLYTTLSNLKLIFPGESRIITFILVSVSKDLPPRVLARRIEKETGLRARSSEDFKIDTLRWYLVNSEDVGDMTAMLILAMVVGFGVTGIMLYMFTIENIRQYAVLTALGTSDETLLEMVFVQAAVVALLGAAIGIGACAFTDMAMKLAGIDYPFRLMLWAPIIGVLGVLTVSFTAAILSIRPVLKLDPGIVFSGR
ncbi:FtsX-like permease family protein [Hydrogenimonas cancrithermarum]|uniref:ABC transporter permease n=1 Tax=Hydrogenimonas cancrithermarum TaxID=2993563 RepID=A0ABN6WT51_9BACT|nr:ABC transporter permease [Hydrogenimonas cancrithermarum]BDY12305.1 ABC transporter permease [Hydrogenimonas cancrithermarum]